MDRVEFEIIANIGNEEIRDILLESYRSKKNGIVKAKALEILYTYRDTYAANDKTFSAFEEAISEVTELS